MLTTLYCSVLLTGAAFLDGSILEIWKMNNSGVSIHLVSLSFYLEHPA